MNTLDVAPNAIALEQWRDTLSLTQVQWRETIETSKSTYHRWINHETILSFNLLQLVNLREATGRSIDDLVDELLEEQSS